MSQLRIMGCGDIGRRVASLYQNEGQALIGWVRSVETMQQCQQQGMTVHRVDMDADGLSLNADFEQAEVFWFMPPPPNGLVDSRLRRFLSVVQGAPKRIVLISTTGVYGDCNGSWIDESQPLQPVAARAIRRVDAEAALRDWGEEHQSEWVILRVPGIYAADRLPLARLLRGDPVLKENEVPWTNRIHADDLAQVCKKAMELAPANSIYNATDGHPLTMTDYFNQVADYAGIPRPPQVSLDEAQNTMSAGMLSYLAESRRIGNEKLLRELAISFQYPSLFHGLENVKEP